MNTKITSGKRRLSVLLTVIMVLSMAPTPVFAADDTCSHVDYSPVDGKCDNCGETMPGSESAVALLIQDNVSVYMDSYMSLQTALDDTSSTGGATVYLLSDIVPGAEEDIFNIAGPDEIIFDLNGYHISDFNVGWQYFDEEKGEITRSLSSHVTIRDSHGGGGITGQTWVFSNDNPSVAPSTLTVEGGTFSSEDNIDTMSGIQLENSTVTVNGGMVWYLGCSGGSGTVNIAGGSEHSGYWDVSGGTWYISAGTFGEVVFVDPDTQRQDVVISGGTFEKISTVSSRGSSFNAPLSALLADGYAFYSQNADGSAYDTCENAASTNVLNCAEQGDCQISYAHHWRRWGLHRVR